MFNKQYFQVWFICKRFGASNSMPSNQFFRLLVRLQTSSKSLKLLRHFWCVIAFALNKRTFLVLINSARAWCRRRWLFDYESFKSFSNKLWCVMLLWNLVSNLSLLFELLGYIGMALPRNKTFQNQRHAVELLRIVIVG